jgi:hypothetical protein
MRENNKKSKMKIIVASEFFNPDNSKIIRSIMKSGKNKIIYPPKMSFDSVVKNIGFPIVSKELAQKIRGVLDVKTNGK